MCGIVGCAGSDRCVEVLMGGLRNLEYRGYDSAGLALSGSGGIERLRRVGALENLASAVEQANGEISDGVMAGVGHTRWATHGRPTEGNAHPHSGGDGTVAVVHNGIIENHARLREELEERGWKFASETDTEVIAHLLAERVRAGEGLREALASVVERLEGSFAVAAVCAAEPSTVVAARNQSPLVVGLGDGENYVASAISALSERTRRFLVVENGEFVEITGDAARLFDAQGSPVEREVLEVDWDEEAVERGGYESFMLKEIHEQPAAISRTLSGRLDTEGDVHLSEIGMGLTGIERVHVVACGTAYHAGLLGKQIMERLCRVGVEVSVASEYRYGDPVGDERTLVVAISQSGETTDTLAAVETARGFGGKVLAITNTRGSQITRESDGVLLTRAGLEVGVAATKTFVAQITALYLLALWLAREQGRLPGKVISGIGRELRLIPDRVEEAIELAGQHVEAAARVFEGARCSLFLGRGYAYPVALEGALKLKEISYLPSEGYPAGEMKHGPIALVDESCPVVGILGEGLMREKTLSNLEETVARGASVIAIVREGDEEVFRLSRAVLPVPYVSEVLAPLVWSVPLQMLAYRVAADRGLDVDKPRNLAKSVTVE